MVKNLLTNAGDAGDMGLIPGGADPLEEEMVTHSSILGKYWEISWTEETGRLTVHGVSKSWT